MQKMILIGVENFERRTRIVSIFRDAGFRVIEAESGSASITLLKRNKKIALALLDIEMSDLRGVDFAMQIQLTGRPIPVVALVDKASGIIIQELFELGVTDYVHMDDEPLRFVHTVSLMLKNAAFEREVHFLRREGEDNRNFSTITALSPKMIDALNVGKKAAQTLDPVLIEGEIGCGKETYARIIHHESSNMNGPFIRFFCTGEDPDAEQTSLPDISKVVQKAIGGTLCFVNIDSLSLKSQQALLKELVVSMKNIGKKKHKSQVRLMATCGANSQVLIEDGILDADLVAFFSTYHVYLPSLRERREDIQGLADKTVKRMASKLGKENIVGIHSAAMVLLAQQNWPHNITELENVIFRAIALGKGPLLQINDFRQLLRKPLQTQHSLDDHIESEKNDHCIDFFDENGHIRPMAEIESAAIDSAMKRYNGHMSEVARRLKISRSTLYRKVLLYYGEEAIS